MSPVAPRRRRGVLPLFALGLLTVAALAGVALLLERAGIVRLPWPRSVEAAEDDDPAREGKVAVPMCMRPVTALAKVTRDDLWDAANQRIGRVWLAPEQVSPEMVTDLGEVIGRVLARDKAPGFVFTEADFLPRGTRPGLVGGIPAGKRAMRIEVSTIPGLFGLNSGDRFDLVSTLAIETKTQDLSRLDVAGDFGPQLAMQASLANALKRATVKVVVQNGIVVQPVTTRQVPYSQSSLTQGLIVRTRPVQEIVIAVDPVEVATLTEAIAVKAEIACVPRSGRPDEPSDSVTPDPQPAALGLFDGLGPHAASMLPELTVVETIHGTTREMSAIPVFASKPGPR